MFFLISRGAAVTESPVILPVQASVHPQLLVEHWCLNAKHLLVISLWRISSQNVGCTAVLIKSRRQLQLHGVHQPHKELYELCKGYLRKWRSFQACHGKRCIL